MRLFVDQVRPLLFDDCENNKNHFLTRSVAQSEVS
jgi:hypothetical protein